MSLNVSICFSFFLFYLNFVNSFPDSDVLYRFYSTKLKEENDEHNLKTIVFKNEFDEICQTGIQAWGYICKDVLQRLRTKPVYSNLYMNYLAFAVYDKERCSKRKVWVPFLHIYAEQQSFPCFGRPAITEMENEQEELLLRYMREIVIYPCSKTIMMVFHYNEADGNYLLLDMLEHFVWQIDYKYDLDYEKVFTTPVPYSYSKTELLYNELMKEGVNIYKASLNPANIINLADKYVNFKICNIVYRLSKYGGKITNFQETIKRPYKMTLILRTKISDTGTSVAISAYSCLTISKKGTPSNKYKISAGPDNNSLILLKEKNNSYGRTVEIIELIKNLFIEYVELYWEGYY